MSIDISIVVPTYNERENIAPIINSIDSALKDLNWEIIFVDDDSPDGTANLIKDFSKKDIRVRCIRRLHRRGLTSAALEGILASSATCVAIMDADLQHDESLLSTMFKKLSNNEADIVVGSRYIDGGSTGTGLSPLRLMMSSLATSIGKKILNIHITDPMSGYFMIRRETFESELHNLSGRGFKILLDLLASMSQRIRVLELPYTMRQRLSGESKLDAMVIGEYYMLLLDKLIGNYIPVRFLLFITVGMLGVLIHLLILMIMFRLLENPFSISQITATIVAMTTNFVLNNKFTYRDMRLTGKAFMYGLLSFYLACSIGALINVQLSEFMYTNGVNWIIAGITGAFIGSVWNYSMTATFTWRKKRS